MSVALIIIYNHQYNSNIDKLEKLYAERFKTIFHLVPFYSGSKSNVIPVYENSLYFQGYVAQGLSSFFNEDLEHYFFIGDDLVLNPIINQSNYLTHLHLNKHKSFLPEILNFHDVQNFWTRTKEAFNYNLRLVGVEAENQLPPKEIAIEKMKTNKIYFTAVKYSQIFQRPVFSLSFWSLIKNIRYFKNKFKEVVFKKRLSLSYPLIGGYADIFVISGKTIKEFCHYSGVFAATRLHVEVAVPTAIVLTSEQIVTEKELLLQGRALWTNEDSKILDKYNFDLNQLLTDFPKNHLYIHPVKLSKWKIK